jgi:hypothetical protein
MQLESDRECAKCLLFYTMHVFGKHMQIHPVKRIILESKSEMCKWFIFKRLFPAYLCSGLFQYEERLLHLPR